MASVIAMKVETALCYIILVNVAMVTCHSPGMANNHEAIPMGVPSNGCDNGKWKINIDWDDTNDYQYTCQGDEKIIPTPIEATPVSECLAKNKIPFPEHKCFPDPITYEDTPPTSGPHRPLWPVYGEYLYCPQQRWVHALEHGAAVFLYHPCADPRQIKRLKILAKSCIRRHVITPYRELAEDNLFAVITYGCRLQMKRVDQDAIVDFITRTALTAPEWKTTKDGQYDHGLLHKADIVTDIEDSTLCPLQKKMMTAETMDELIKYRSREKMDEHLSNRPGS